MKRENTAQRIMAEDYQNVHDSFAGLKGHLPSPALVVKGSQDPKQSAVHAIDPYQQAGG